MPHINTNGIQLAYDESSGGEKTLILLHGLTANRHSFDGLLRSGLARSLRVVRVDLRGRGESDKPDTGYSMADHARDIGGLMDALEIERASLVGHSFGGLLSIYMAAHMPERLEKIVILDAGLEATHPSTLEKIRPSLERLGKTIPSWETYIEAIKSSPYYQNKYWDADLEAYYRADVEVLAGGAVRSKVKAKAIEAAVKHVIAEDWRAHLSQVKRPALLINAPAPFGTENAPPVLSELGARETVDLMPDASFAIVPGHHITMLFGENARHTLQAIRDFVLSDADA